MKSAILAGCTALALSASLHAANLGTIMPLGDSITEGQYFPSGTVGVGNVSDFPGGYRDPFYTDLAAVGDTFQFVGSQTINPSPKLIAAGETQEEGHPGFTSTNLYGAFGSLNDNLPNYFTGAAATTNDVLLLIGTNDVNYGVAYGTQFSPAYTGTIPLHIFQLDPTAHLFWSLLPPSPANTATNNAVVTYNSYITTEAATLASEGYDVTLVDNYTPLSIGIAADPLMFADNIHPSQLGYSTIGNDFAAAVVSSVPEPAAAATLIAGVMMLRRRRA